MKRHIFLALSLFCFLLSGLCLFSIKRGQDEILASRISPQVLRFHVLANSDSCPPGVAYEKFQKIAQLVKEIRV